MELKSMIIKKHEQGVLTNAVQLHNLYDMHYSEAEGFERLYSKGKAIAQAECVKIALKLRNSIHENIVNLLFLC